MRINGTKLCELGGSWISLTALREEGWMALPKETAVTPPSSSSFWSRAKNLRVSFVTLLRLKTALIYIPWMSKKQDT